MLRRRILMNTCISTKRRAQAKKKANSGMNKTMMTTMIMKKMKTNRRSGTKYLTGSSIQNLYLPYIYPPLIWEDRDVISKNAYKIYLPPNVMYSLVFYGKGMVITDLLLDLTGPSPNGEYDFNIDLV